MESHVVVPVYGQIDDRRTGRLRARTIDLKRLIADAAEGAAEYTAAFARHGGSVPNSYGYPAETECGFVGVAHTPDAIYMDVFAGQLPANKVTLAGVASAAGYRGIYDHRFSGETKEAILDRLRRDILARQGEMKLIGYVAEHGGRRGFAWTPEGAIEKCAAPYAAALLGGSR